MFSSRMMMPNTIVVAPTTAVPMRTGFDVALNVFPAPSPFSSWYLAFSKSGLKPKVFLSSAPILGRDSIWLNSYDRLSVVGDGAEAIHGDGHGAHPEETERDQTEGEDRRGEGELRGHNRHQR